MALSILEIEKGIQDKPFYSATGYCFVPSQPKEIKLKVVSIGENFLTFEDFMSGKSFKLESDHESDCCENHYLSFEHFTIKDFEGLKFDLSNDKFFEKVPEYGIRLLPLNGHPIPVPGYGYNNGYYGTNLCLKVTDGDGNITEYDITECQVIEG
jgi:hypothetical protein